MMQPAESGRQWVHLIPAGTFKGRDGRGPYTVGDADQVVEETIALAGKRQIAIDYEHQIDFASKNGQPAPAAGWIAALEVRQDGIWGLVKWTATERQYLDQREYRYLSPVFHHTRAGEVKRLLRAALTNNPNLDQLAALATSETQMDNPLAELIEFAGLPEDADWPAVIAKLTELKASAHGAVPDPAQYVPIAEFEHAVGEVNRLNQGVSETRAKHHVEAQIQGGRMPPFLRDWGVSLCTVNMPAFDAFVDRTGGTVRQLFEPSGATAAPPDTKNPSGLTAQEREFCVNMVLSEAELLKSRQSLQTQEG